MREFRLKSLDHFLAREMPTWGSPMLADGKVYVGSEDGTFAIFAASKDKKVISQVDMPAPVYSTPIIANGVLYVATTTHLYAIEQKK